MSGLSHKKLDTRRQDLKPNLEKLGLSSRSGLLTSSCLTGNLTSSLLREDRSSKSEHLRSHSDAQRNATEKRIQELRKGLRDTTGTEETAPKAPRLISSVKLTSSLSLARPRDISPQKSVSETKRQEIRTQSKSRLENERTSSSLQSSLLTSGLSQSGTKLIQTSITRPKLGDVSTKSHVQSSYGTVSTSKPPPSPPKRARVEVAETERYDAYCNIEQPMYHLNLDNDTKEFNFEEHIPLNQNQIDTTIQKPLHDVMSIKNKFINAVSGSLIKQPDFKENLNTARKDLLHMAEVVINYDAEFILKVALYTRKELNIRTTGNFLLAVASNSKECRPYLKRYYSTTIVLPSDWIDVAEMYQAFGDKNINFGSLPSALRRVMKAKFTEFDKYQLAKYNKESSQKKKKKKEKGKVVRSEREPLRPMRSYEEEYPKLGRRSYKSDTESEEEMEIEYEDPELLRQPSYGDQSETEEEIEKKTFTLKQLIRKLHITEPPEHVLCLIGKKYPATLDEFYQSRLPGVFDETKAGTRMKLPVPETWETQVSLKGNKASTWESLINHKKLPFMAMLRNLRNMIQAGISEKHHQWVIKKLNDEGAVIYSKQFPFRFFSAYHALGELQENYEMTQRLLVQGATRAASVGRGRGGRGRMIRGRGRGRGGRGRNDDKPVKETLYDTRIIDRYRKALDNAVKIATVHNVKPIKGTTIIFCNVGDSMDRPCTAAKGLGKPRTLAEIAILMGLMCKYSCEECKMIIYSDESREVELEKGTILDNMESVLALKDILNNCGGQLFPEEKLKDLLVDRVQIDNLIVLSDGMHPNSHEGKTVTNFLKLYRRMVNQNLLFVNVNLASRDSGFSSQVEASHDNDIYISGYSDQILRFIAERGDEGQLIHVEKIDEAYDLKKVAVTAGEKVDAKPETKIGPEKPLPIALLPQWRTVRVFISSTFRDMHGERDLLTRYIFPELRARAKKHFINVYEVDLRWGVTEEDTRSHGALEMCLSEVQKCQYFVGLLGERYGWRPQAEDLPNMDGIEYKENSSVTELEMMAFMGHRNKMTDKQERAFFYMRDNSFEKELPKRFAIDFESEDSEAADRMAKLKTTLRRSDYEVYDKYPCRWGGVAENKPVVVGLEHFGTRVLNNLWNAIQKHYPDEGVWLDEFSHLNAKHEAFREKKIETFVGRKKLITQCMNTIQDMENGLLVLHGTQGSGKSALMATLVREYVQSPLCDTGRNVLSHFLGASPGSTNIMALMRRLCHEMNARFNLGQTLPENYKNLVLKFEEMLKQAAGCTSSPLIIVIDGMDLLDNTNEARLMDWIPEELPTNVLLIVSVQDNSNCYKALKRRTTATLIPVGTLDILDKSEVVRKILANYGKTLEETPFNNQMKLLVAKKQANLPLFLSLACEELRVFGVFEDMTAKLRSIPHTVPLLLHDILIRLEEDHGKNIVSTALSLLVCSRNGLTKEELHDLLSLYNVLGSNKLCLEEILKYELVPTDGIPVATFSQLIRALQGFLLPMGETSSEQQLCIAHEYIELAIKQRYLKTASFDQETHLHQLLAGYYMKEADEWNDRTWQGVNVKAFCELPYHLFRSKNYDELKEVLCSLNFINKKCILGMAPNLLEDFLQEAGSQKSADRERAKFLSQEKVQQYQSFVSRNVHILKSSPTLTFQQAYNEPKDSSPAIEARELLAEGMKLNSSLIEWVNKPLKADSCQLSIAGLSEVVTCIAIAPDCNSFACGSQDCSVKLYDIGTGKEMRSFSGHASPITDLCFAGNDRLCTASTETDLCLWDAKQGHRVAILTGHRKRVNACVSDPDGKIIVSAGWDCGLKVWNARDGKLDSDLKGNQKPLNCISFHPEGQMVVTGGWDATLKIWDTFNRKKIAVLRGHLTSVRDVAYNPRGSHIASASLDGEVKLWSAAQGTQVGTFSGHALPINRLAFTPSGQELITVSDDQKVKIWSGYMGKLVQNIEDENEEAAKCVAISPEGNCVAVGYYSGTVKMFDIYSGIMDYRVKHHKGPVTCIRFNSKGNHILTGSQDATLKIMVADTGHRTHTLSGHSSGVLSVAFGEKYIVSTSEDFTCNVYRLSKLKDGCAPTYTLHGHEAFVTGCSFDPEEGKLATCGRDDVIYIWDLTKLSPNTPSKTPMKTLKGCHSDWINGISWSNTGDFIVSGSNDFNLKLWDLKTNKSKVDFKGHTSTVSTVEYKYGCIVSGSTDGEVKVWSHKGNEITTLRGHKERVNCCDIYVKVHVKEEQATESSNWAAQVEEDEWNTEHKASALDKKNVRVLDVIVASCSDDGTVNIWQPLEGTEIACLDGHSDRVVGVAASADGRICTSSLDKSIKVWRPQLSEEVVPQSHNAEVTSVDYSPSGKYVLSASRDGIVKVWEHEKDAQPVCIYEFRAHDKAVNTLTCMGGNDEMFATGSSDKSIKIWKLIKTKKGLRVKKAKSIKLQHPVSAIASVPNSNLIVGDIEGYVRSFKVDSLKEEGKTVHLTKWILCVDYSNPGLICVGSTCNKMKIQDDSHAEGVEIAYEYNPEIPIRKRQENWVTAVCATNQNAPSIAGDVFGQLTLVDKRKDQSLQQLKAHGASVTGCVYEDSLKVLYSASEDKTVKIWQEKDTLHQIGQFQGPGCISCIAKHPKMTRARNGCMQSIVCGDQKGNINFLECRLPFYK